jgi:hypothetical protein
MQLPQMQFAPIQPPMTPVDQIYYDEDFIMEDMINVFQGSEHDGLDIGDTPLFDDNLPQTTSAYTEVEEKLICESCIKIGQDPICGAEQQGGQYWKRVHKYSTSINSSFPKILRMIRMNCQFKRGGYLSKRNATNFVEHTSM